MTLLHFVACLLLHGLADGDFPLVLAAFSKFVGNIVGRMFFVGAMFGKLFEGDSGSHLGFNRFFGFVLITGETRTNIELTHGEFNIMIMYFAFCTS